MSLIGCKHLVASPVATYTEGSGITYGTGFVVGPLVAVNLSFNVADNPDFGDDVELDNDDGINGYNGTMDMNKIALENRAKLLNWKTTGTTDIVYHVTDAMPKEHGWGYYRVMMDSGVKTVEAMWFHRAKFTQQSMSDNTKKRSIEWGHPQLAVNGIGAILDGSGDAEWFIPKVFTGVTAEADAAAWLDTKAGVPSTPAATT